MRLNADGSYTLDPDHCPPDLVYLRDVYGHRRRVRRRHLDDVARVLLPLYNQYGHRVKDGLCIHRDNVAIEGAIAPAREVQP